MRIWLPKRWSRAKRKRIRVEVALERWREEIRRTLHAAIDRVWSDMMDMPSAWQSGGFISRDAPFVDDAELP